MLVFVVSQGSSQRPNVPREICLLDKGVSPYLSHQFVLLDQAPPISNQHQKRLKCLWSQLNGLSVPQQQVFCRIETELAEFIQSIEPIVHRVTEKLWRILGEIFKDFLSAVRLCWSAYALEQMLFAFEAKP